MDSDGDVVLKGSELYKYLISNCKEPFDVGETNLKAVDKEMLTTTHKQPFVSVSSDVKSYIDIILNSNVILEEDASYLFTMASDLEILNKGDRYYMGAFSGVTLATVFFTGCLVPNLFSAVAPLGLGSAIYLVYFIINRIRQNSRNTILKSLHSNINKIFYFVRKINQVINDYKSYAYQTAFKQQIRKQNDVNTKNMSCGVTKGNECEILIISNSLAQCYLDLISAAKNATLSLISAFPLTAFVDSQGHYLAYYSDEELGLNNYRSSNSLENCYSTDSLEVLKNICVLMQSESLRRLGLCFCLNLWQKNSNEKALCDVFDIVKMYSLKCENILNFIENKFKVLFASKPLKKEKKLINSKLNDDYSRINKLSFVFKNFVYDIQQIEEIIELNEGKDHEEIVMKIYSKLDEVERGVHDSISLLHDMKKHFNYQVQNNSQLSQNIDSGNCGMKSPEIFSKIYNEINDLNELKPEGDMVYFDKTNSIPTITSSIDDLELKESYTFPQYLLAELKSCLIMKRKEFDERELKAIKENCDYDKYKTFVLDTNDNEDNSNDKVKNDSNPGIPPSKHKFTNPKQIDIKTNITDYSEMNFQKSLALKVASNSLAWDMGEEETYGSDNDSDT